jgi:hypothetical protein
MQVYKDTVTGQYYQFEDDVVVAQVNGVYTFTAAHGVRLNVPTTLTPGELPAPPIPTLDELKATKLVTINADCMTAIDVGFTYDGHTYDSDLISRTNIIGTAAGVNSGIALPAGFTWRTKDNQNVPMDGSGVIALGAALLVHVNTQYATSWALKAQVAAVENPPDLDPIVWPTAA